VISCGRAWTGPKPICPPPAPDNHNRKVHINSVLGRASEAFPQSGNASRYCQAYALLYTHDLAASITPCTIVISCGRAWTGPKPICPPPAPDYRNRKVHIDSVLGRAGVAFPQSGNASHLPVRSQGNNHTKLARIGCLHALAERGDTTSLPHAFTHARIQDRSYNSRAHAPTLKRHVLHTKTSTGSYTCGSWCSRPSRVLAFLAFLRTLISPSGQAWQCWQSTPFPQPCAFQNHAQGLQCPVPWSSDPVDWSPNDSKLVLTGASASPPTP